MKKILIICISLFLLSFCDTKSAVTPKDTLFSWQTDLQGWNTYSLIGSKTWVWNTNKVLEVQSLATADVNAWAVSPEFDMSASVAKKIRFGKCQYVPFDSCAVNVYYTENFTGDVKTTVWNKLLSDVLKGKANPNGTSFDWYNDSCDVNTTGAKVRFAIQYLADTCSLATLSKIRINNFLVKGGAIFISTEKIIKVDTAYAPLFNPTGATSAHVPSEIELNGWRTQSVKGSVYWWIREKGTARIKPSTTEEEDWLVTPAFDLSKDTLRYLSCSAGWKPKNNCVLGIYYSTDYTGDVTKANWTVISDDVLKGWLLEGSGSTVAKKMFFNISNLRFSKIYFAYKLAKGSEAASEVSIVDFKIDVPKIFFKNIGKGKISSNKKLKISVNKNKGLKKNSSIYLVPVGTTKDSAAIFTNKKAELPLTDELTDSLSLNAVPLGQYFAYAIGRDSLTNKISISYPSDTITVVEAPFFETIKTGEVMKARGVKFSTNYDGIVYLVPQATALDSASIVKAQIMSDTIKAYTTDTLKTVTVPFGDYVMYGFYVSPTTNKLAIAKSNVVNVVDMLFFESISEGSIQKSNGIKVKTNINATLYLVSKLIVKDSMSIVKGKKAMLQVTEGVESTINTSAIADGEYVVYGFYIDEITKAFTISNASGVIKLTSTAIDDNRDAEKKIYISNNPVISDFDIYNIEGIQSIRIYNVNGTLILNQPVSKNEEKINISDCASGIYFVTLISENRIAKVIKIIKL